MDRVKKDTAGGRGESCWNQRQMLGLVLKCNTETNRAETECVDVDLDKWVDEGVTVCRGLQKLSSYYFYLTGRERGQRNMAQCQQIRMRMGEEMLEAVEKG